ncbi:hypothetical protein BC943DRAFT_382750 [Umbelopsis sp. AD052]|nr:hypothetical protein BC943DRAFT_382750 [Umbelopsis sp. AD052]
MLFRRPRAGTPSANVPSPVLNSRHWRSSDMHAAAEVNAYPEAINFFTSNAAIMVSPHRTTSDVFEAQIDTNYIEPTLPVHQLKIAKSLVSNTTATHSQYLQCYGYFISIKLSWQYQLYSRSLARDADTEDVTLMAAKWLIAPLGIEVHSYITVALTEAAFDPRVASESGSYMETAKLP